MKTADLLMSQIEALAKLTSDLHSYAVKNGPDGWDREELEMVDSMTNTIIRQGWGILGGIGEPLKKLRNEIKAEVANG